MRTSRLLAQVSNKFTGNKSSSPVRMREPGNQIPTFTNLNLAAHTFYSTCTRTHPSCTRAYSSCTRSPQGRETPRSQHSRTSLVNQINLLNIKSSTGQQRRSFTKEAEIPPEPGLNLFYFKKFFRLRGLNYQESHACLQVQVPNRILENSLEQSVPPEDISTSLVFVNKKTGGFVIPRFGITGTWLEFEHLISTWIKNRNTKRSDLSLPYPKLQRINPTLPQSCQNLLQTLNPIQDISSQQFKELLKNLKLLRRDFEIQDFSKFDARVNEDLTEIYFPIRFTDGNIIGLRKVHLEEREVVETHLPYTQLNSIIPFLHGVPQTENYSSCILVSSVLDSVILSSRMDIPVIALPDSSNLYPDHIPFLDKFETIFIWLNNDVQGVQNSKLFAQKIDEKKCRLVSSEYPNPFNAVRQRVCVDEALSSAKSIYHQFLTNFENLRDSVYLEFIQSDELMGTKWKRFDPLNSILGGFRRGELTIFSGRTGSGKTTFLSEYSLDLCMEGVNTLWCSFEVKNTRLLKMMMKQFSLINLDEEISEFNKVGDRFSKLPLFLTDFHGSQDITRVNEAMSHAVYVHDISHVIVDNMQFMLGTGAGYDRFQAQDSAVELFRRFATAHNCHVSLVIHPRKEDEDVLTTNSIFGGAKATQEADNVLLLQEEQSQQSFFKRKSVQVVKNRYAGDLGSIPLTFNKPTLTFSKKVADQFKRQARLKPTTFITQT